VTNLTNEGATMIAVGDVFDTPFVSGCVALTAPDELGSFDGLDSDGIRCSFTDPAVVDGAMPLTVKGRQPESIVAGYTRASGVRLNEEDARAAWL
jgi:hypothetical protein